MSDESGNRLKGASAAAFEQYVTRLLREMAAHELVHVAEDGAVSSWFLRRPGTWKFSTLITFTPAGIALQGDLTPGRYGVCSQPGYGLEWFASELNPDYLAQKFLRMGFVKELAFDDLWEDAQSDERPLSKEEQAELRRRWEAVDENDVFAAHKLYREYVGEFPENWNWYDPQQQAILTAIQCKFRELRRKRVPQCTDGGACTCAEVATSMRQLYEMERHLDVYFTDAPVNATYQIACEALANRRRVLLHADALMDLQLRMTGRLLEELDALVRCGRT